MESPGPPALLLVPLVLGLPCVVAVAVGGELSVLALAAVGVVGTLIVGVGLVLRAGSRSSPVGRLGLPWAAWLGACLGWEVVGLTSPGVPSLSDLADPVLAHPPVRAVGTALWLAAGVRLTARPGGRRG